MENAAVEDSELLAALSPNGLPSDYLQTRRTMVNQELMFELRQVRNGEPGRSIYLPTKTALITALKGWEPDISFGEASRLITEIHQSGYNRIEVRTTAVGTEPRVELRQVRKSGARSIYLTAVNVSEVRNGYGTRRRGVDADYGSGSRIARCRACGQPTCYKAGTERTILVNCSDSCAQQKNHRLNEHRDSLICQLVADGAHRTEVADRYGLTTKTLIEIINVF